ncbi:hypothetical protein LR021_02670, partial [Candidatus Bipolaricaulota bacterium]|nr:hypothetical protein [Candidatus Bipolaricaulota bacterium]
LITHHSGLLAGTPSIIRVYQCPSVVLSSLGRGSGMGLLNMCNSESSGRTQRITKVFRFLVT